MILDLRRKAASAQPQPAAIPGLPAPLQPKPRRVYPQVYVTLRGQTLRGHHLRGDQPGHVTCPFCSCGQIDGQEGCRCACGAQVTQTREDS